MATTLQRKPIAVDGAWLLTDHDGKTAQEWLFAAIAALTPAGWRGTPLASTPGGEIDRAQFDHDGDPLGAKQSQFGQWIVLDAGVLKVLSAGDCAATYDVVEV